MAPGRDKPSPAIAMALPFAVDATAAFMFSLVPFWAAKIELESLIVLAQYNPPAKEYG